MLSNVARVSPALVLSGSATVTFDDAKATVATIADASEHAGYPATLKE